jgi:hypothetical protein
MSRFFASAVLGFYLVGLNTVWAEDCAPHCDYWHFYGPYDFSYIRPGMFGYPICDRQGNCSPHLVYVYSDRRYGRITVRSASKTTRHNRDAGHSAPPSNPEGR